MAIELELDGITIKVDTVDEYREVMKHMEEMSDAQDAKEQDEVAYEDMGYEEEAELKVGDKVKIVSGGGRIAHCFTIGTIGEVEHVYSDGDVEVKYGMTSQVISKEDLELVESDEETIDLTQFKEGDRFIALQDFRDRSGDLVEEGMAMTVEDECYGSEDDLGFRLDNDEYMVFGAERFKYVEKLDDVDEDNHQNICLDEINEGDKLEAIEDFKDPYKDLINKGEVLEVFRVVNPMSSTVFRVHTTTQEGNFMVITENEVGSVKLLEKAEPQIEDSQSEAEFKVGDKVVVIADKYGHRVPVGTVTTVREVHDLGYSSHIPYLITPEDEFFEGYAGDDEIRLATDDDYTQTETEECGHGLKVGDKVEVIDDYILADRYRKGDQAAVIGGEVRGDYVAIEMEETGEWQVIRPYYLKKIEEESVADLERDGETEELKVGDKVEILSTIELLDRYSEEEIAEVVEISYYDKTAKIRMNDCDTQLIPIKNIKKLGLIEHDGKKLREVDRRAEVGDYVTYVGYHEDRGFIEVLKEVDGELKAPGMFGGPTFTVYGWDEPDKVYEVVEEESSTNNVPEGEYQVDGRGPNIEDLKIGDTLEATENFQDTWGDTIRKGQTGVIDDNVSKYRETLSVSFGGLTMILDESMMHYVKKI